MDTDHGRLYVAMAEKFLNRGDILTPDSGYVADKLQPWVISGGVGLGFSKSGQRRRADHQRSWRKKHQNLHNSLTHFQALGKILSK